MEAIENVRKHLQEVLGIDAKNAFSDEVIRKHLSYYRGRADDIQCALESLCEDYYEESNKFLNQHLPSFALPADINQTGPVEFFQNPFKRKKLGRAAKDISSTLETGLHNVAENLEGAFVTLGEGTAERAGCVSRTSSSSSVRDQQRENQSPTQTFEGSERERLFESGNQSSSGPAGPMGCGSSYDQRGGHEAAPDPASAHCDLCGKTFSFISRRRTCVDCANVFCSSCLPAKGGTCSRCGVLNKRPALRGELMKLRVKDLQHFLTRKRINIKSCVEKKDLVELVLQHSGVPSPVDESVWEDAGIRVSDQVPLERRGTFPQNYVDSHHRREWFQEKFGAETDHCDETTPVEDIQASPTEDTTTRVEEIEATENNDEVMSVVLEDEDEADSEDKREKTTNVNEEPSDVTLAEDPEVESETDGAVGGITEAEDKSKQNSTLPKHNFDHLSDNVHSTSLPGSPRRFANHGLVYLSEIESLDDLKELSTKQIKDLLAMNRVNFKGCVEKEELLKILQRLWKQDQRNKDNLETMEDESLCKICMDSPIDCVMLECGHMCTCTNCGKQMAECPICRQYVVR